MAFNSQITRTDAQALMPEDVAREIITNVPEMSAVLRLARRLPNMSRAQTRMPVLASLITAGFVSGDTGLKATSEVSWTNKYINAAELAVIVPIPENVLADAAYDIWGGNSALDQRSNGCRYRPSHLIWHQCTKRLARRYS